MSTIRAIAGIRYATSSSSDISALIAPPYDILDDAGKAELLGHSPRNFVELDLPHMPPKSAGPAAEYEAAARTLNDWLRAGILVRDREPALYVYHQIYTHNGTRFVRKMFFAGLKLEPFGEGSIFPHERTFGGPKEDRLMLTKATKANMSPIFGLYEDSQNIVTKTLEKELPAQPLATGTLDGVENRLWAVTDTAVLNEVSHLMAPKPTYIADGHHRCGTAMLYRDWLVQQQGPLPPDHPANFVLCVFCAMEDPGLQILPTHRIVPGVQVTAEWLKNDSRLDVAALEIGPNRASEAAKKRAQEVSGPTLAIEALKKYGPQAIAVFNAGGRGSTGTDGEYLMLRPKSADILDALEPERTPAWRRLGLAFLHAYVLDRLVTPKLCGGKAPEIKYIKSDAEAIKTAHEVNGTAFLMQPTTMEELRSVCSAGDLMPQKSTYFYPKLASGLVINPLC